MVLKHCSGTVSFAMLVTFTCLLFSFGELCPVGDGPLTSCLQPAVSQPPPLHRLDVSCASLSGQQTAFVAPSCFSGRRLQLQYLFQRLFIKLQFHSAVGPPWVSPCSPFLRPATVLFSWWPFISLRFGCCVCHWLLDSLQKAVLKAELNAWDAADCYCGCRMAPPHVESLMFKVLVNKTGPDISGHQIKNLSDFQHLILPATSFSFPNQCKPTWGKSLFPFNISPYWDQWGSRQNFLWKSSGREQNTDTYNITVLYLTSSKVLCFD